jgi:hypothetical protein
MEYLRKFFSLQLFLLLLYATVAVYDILLIYTVASDIIQVLK